MYIDNLLHIRVEGVRQNLVVQYLGGGRVLGQS